MTNAKHGQSILFSESVFIRVNLWLKLFMDFR